MGYRDGLAGHTPMLAAPEYMAGYSTGIGVSTRWSVRHYTYFSEETLHAGLTFEEAKALCRKYAADESSEGLGQSKREIEAPMTTKVPFQVEIKTMTAEAGDVSDLYTAEQKDIRADRTTEES